MNLYEFARHLEKKFTREVLQGQAITKASLRIASYLKTKAKMLVMNYPDKTRKFGGNKNGLFLHGGLVNSINAYASRDGKNQTITLGASARYAAIHELGGEIRPVRAKALTIPLNQKAQGLYARNYPAKLIRLGRLLVDVDELQKYKGGSRRIPDAAKAYVLAKKVTIPPRPYLSLTLERARKHIDKIIAQELKKHVGD
jgi:phage gpG-like protein